jgi:hypothetical protein
MAVHGCASLVYFIDKFIIKFVQVGWNVVVFG